MAINPATEAGPSAATWPRGLRLKTFG